MQFAKRARWRIACQGTPQSAMLTEGFFIQRCASEPVLKYEPRLTANEPRAVRRLFASGFCDIRLILAVEADDAARFFNVVVARDGDEEQVELGNVLDQFDG